MLARSPVPLWLGLIRLVDDVRMWESRSDSKDGRVVSAARSIAVSSATARAAGHAALSSMSDNGVFRPQPTARPTAGIAHFLIRRSAFSSSSNAPASARTGGVACSLIC